MWASTLLYPPSQLIIPQFDDILGSAVIPELDEVPVPYFGLAWNAIVAFKDLITTLPPSSGKQVGVVFIGDNIFYQGDSNITTKYDGSKTKYFALENLFQGCVLPLQTGLVPTSCTIKYTGNKVPGKGGPVTQTCAYKAPNRLTTCAFPSTFTDLESVNIAFVPPVTTLKSVLFMDDVNGTVFQ